MVPHLTTALSGPLLELERQILSAMPEIESWFRQQWRRHSAPFYGSVDLRNAGFKLAPVDTNLFPGGFNNLNPDFLPLCVQATQDAIEKVCPTARSLLLVPENHTRNGFYLQNVVKLFNILKLAGLNVRVGTLNPEITEPTELEAAGGETLLVEPVARDGDRLVLEDFDPCAVLLNNDLSAGVPEVLRGLEQTVVPPLHAGWETRRKTRHFAAYDTVAADFARLIDVDPWMINPYFSRCAGLDFHARAGEDTLADTVDALLAKIRAKYDEYGIRHDPYVIVKADAGTYGMGIMSVRDGDQVRNLNRKQRNKMSVIKDNQQVSEVIVQEGVYTFETINEAVAEPVVYMIDHHVVGGFYRVHTARGQDENLNAPGMHFVPLAFESACCLPEPKAHPGKPANRFYSYGVVARLALLAAARELEMPVEGAPA